MDPQRTETGTTAGPIDAQHYFKVRQTIDDYFDVSTLGMAGEAIRFSYIRMKVGSREAARAFAEQGYRLYVRRGAGAGGTGVLVPAAGVAARAAAKEKRTAILLFAATIITTTVAGWFFAYDMYHFGFAASPMPGAVAFSLGLLLILGSHELGHKWASARNGIDASPPFFIPLIIYIPFVGWIPTLGTLGAVIRVRSPIPDRGAAIALGISGPLTGFIFSIPVMIAGMLLSKSVPMPTDMQGGLYFGDSLIIWALTKLFMNIPEGHMTVAHPLLFAGWVGLFVTSLNLIPVGQFDGAHIARAVLGHRRYRILCWVMIAAMFAMGIFWAGWYLWAVIGYAIMRRGYPRYIDEGKPLETSSLVLAAIGLLLFILCFIPIPLRAVG